jgi:hypothetical protein
MVDHPFIYEINTWIWLEDLRARPGKTIALSGLTSPGDPVETGNGRRLARTR